MDACLIAYYSRSGVTATVARALAEVCNAELEPLRPLPPLASIASVGGYLRAAWQALLSRPAAIEPPKTSPAAFPLLVLGTPVWVGHMSSPMRQYILQQRQQMHAVALFCAMGGSQGEQVLQAMAQLCGKTPVATLCLREADVRAGRHIDAVREFAGKLAQARGQQAQAPAQASSAANAAAPPTGAASTISATAGATAAEDGRALAQGNGAAANAQGKGAAATAQGDGAVSPAQGNGATAAGQGNGSTAPAQGNGATAPGQGSSAPATAPPTSASPTGANRPGGGTDRPGAA